MHMTSLEALKKMTVFLDKFYKQTKSDDLGLLLSDISLDTFLDGQTADSAAWADWLEAIKYIKKSNDDNLTQEEAFSAMIIFLQEFGNRIRSSDIKKLLEELLINSDKLIPKKNIWQDWVQTTAY